MQNMKMRLKILLSFGITIALMLGLSGYVIVSNLSTTGNAESIRAEVQMQTLCSALQQSFLEASKSGAVVSSEFNGAEYDNVTSRIAECQTYLEEIRTLMAANSELTQYTQQVEAVAGQIENWTASINSVQETNKSLQGLIIAAQSNQKAITGQSAGIFRYQMRLSRQEAAMDMTLDERLERVDRVEQGMDIATRLNHIGDTFDAMFRALDLSKLEEDKQYVAETVTVLEKFLAGSGLQFNIDTTTAILTALEYYNGNIDDFVAMMGARDSATAAAFSANTSALTDINGLLSTAEEASISFTELTISRNGVALLLNAAISVVALAISIFLALYLSGVVSTPVVMLTNFMKTASTTGDINLTPEDAESMQKLSRTRDELGELIGASRSFIERILEVEKALESLGEGDLTAELPLLSENDTMGLSMQRVMASLNGMFGSIRTATDSVAGGSKQIADGSNALAQNSTEQAATVEELAASISEISHRTQENAGMAEKAAELADAIMLNAEKGSRQMDGMMVAVNAINTSSQSISKVIKVIDDIAFQTNILALNAAVEAARAGQQGKGFAVVADEVRNLAAKSAAAAKDTDALIADSMEKAKSGSAIARETAASLAEIVSGIRESDALIGEIARSSLTQSEGIEQINNGINQVTLVVQQNSATAEESAAAAQELSGQSDTLSQLISRFKLKAGAAGAAANFAPAGPYGAGDEVTAFSMGGNAGKY